MDMLVEQEKVVIKADYRAKHEAKDKTEEPRTFTAEIPPDGFYKDRIKALLDENSKLKAELAAKEKELENINKIIEFNNSKSEEARILRDYATSKELSEKNERIAKLEKAIIEAAIR